MTILYLLISPQKPGPVYVNTNYNLIRLSISHEIPVSHVTYLSDWSHVTNQNPWTWITTFIRPHKCAGWSQSKMEIQVPHPDMTKSQESSITHIKFLETTSSVRGAYTSQQPKQTNNLQIFYNNKTKLFFFVFLAYLNCETWKFNSEILISLTWVWQI